MAAYRRKALTLTTDQLSLQVLTALQRVHTSAEAEHVLAEEVTRLHSEGYERSTAQMWANEFERSLTERGGEAVLAHEAVSAIVDAMYGAAAGSTSTVGGKIGHDGALTSDQKREDQLYAIARRDLQLYKDSAGTFWAGIPQKEGGYHHVELSSRTVNNFLHSRYRRDYGTVVGAEVVRNVLATIEGDLAEESETRDNYVRLAWSPDNGKLYVDLHGNKAVEIDADGWRVIEGPPVYFRRPPGVLPQVEPKHDGSLEALRDILGLADDRTWHLLVGFLIAAYHPTGPYPVLVLSGEQGTGKSTMAILLGRLIDPNKAQLEKAPTREDDIPVQAVSRHLLAWDNLSSVPNWFSDALCGLATELTHSRRKLYSDADLYVFNATKPTLINGIEDLATRPDLLSRALLVHLEKMPEGKRKEREAVFAAFDAARPALLGAICDAVSCAMRNKDRVLIKNAPRMADMAGWVTRAEPALGWPWGTYMESFQHIAEEASSIALESSPVAQALLQWLPHHAKGFNAYAAEFLSELNSSIHVGPEVRRQRGWPIMANNLTNKLRRIAPALRKQGWDIQIERKSKGAYVTVRPYARDDVSTGGDGIPEVVVLGETEIAAGIPTPRGGADGDGGVLRGSSLRETEEVGIKEKEGHTPTTGERQDRHDRHPPTLKSENMPPDELAMLMATALETDKSGARLSRCPTCGQTLGSNPLNCLECEAELVWHTENARCRHRSEYTTGTGDEIETLDWKTSEWRTISTTQTCAQCGATFYCEAPEDHQADWVPFGCLWCNSEVAKQVGKAEERLETLEQRAREQRARQIMEQTVCEICGEPSWPHDLCPMHLRFDLWMHRQATPMFGGDPECTHEDIHEEGDSVIVCEDCGGRWQCEHADLYERFEGGFGCRECGYRWSDQNATPERLAELAHILEIPRIPH